MAKERLGASTVEKVVTGHEVRMREIVRAAQEDRAHRMRLSQLYNDMLAAQAASYDFGWLHKKRA